MDPIIIFFATFLLFLIIGVPIAFAMILPCYFYLWMVGIPITVVSQRLLESLLSPTFLAIPFYILCAEILNATGATTQIFNFARKIFGHFSAGLAHVNVVGSMIFAGMSGSAIADAAGLGRIEIKAMTDSGYDLEYSTAVTATSSIIGPIIPPSIPFVIYGVIAEQSIARLFIGGIIPGIAIGVSLMIAIWYLSKKNPDKFPRDPVPKWKEFLGSAKVSFPYLLLPIIIIGGIFSGYFTPTEAGAIAILYAVIVSIISRNFSTQVLIISFKAAMRSTALIAFVIAAAVVFSWVVTVSQIPKIIVTYIATTITSKTLILLLFALIILLMGSFVTCTASLVILSPVIVQIAPALDIDLIHLGVFLTLGIMIGAATPPVGTVLFVLSDFTGLSVERIAKACFPFLVALIICWLIIIFVPSTVLFLPNLAFK